LGEGKKSVENMSAFTAEFTKKNHGRNIAKGGDLIMGRKPNWSAEDKEYLAESWGDVSVDTICKHLNRSRNGVIVMKGRLKLGAFLNSGEYITTHQFFKEFKCNCGNDYKKISWVKNRGFPVKSKKVGKCKWSIIYIEDFWKWADKNRFFVPFEKLEKNALGVKPDWVDEIRKTKQKRAIAFRTTPWKSDEDGRLKYLLKQHKYGYYELSRLLMRTEGAIARRCVDLGLKERPLRKGPHDNKWTDTDKTAVWDLIKQGCSYELIAEQLDGRSVKSIRGLVGRTLGTENLDKVYEILRWEVD
jgi:hypothetical protein